MNNIGIMMSMEEINDLIAAKDFEAARVELLGLVDSEANNFEYKKLLGLVFINLSKMNEANKYFEDVVKVCPDDAPSWFYLANCYDAIGEYFTAFVAYSIASGK